MFGPSLELGWRKLSESAVYIKENLSYHVSWIIENVPKFAQWVSINVFISLMHAAGFDSDMCNMFVTSVSCFVVHFEV